MSLLIIRVALLNLNLSAMSRHTSAIILSCAREVAEALLERGARADFEDPDGSTPLYAAAFQGPPSCAAFEAHRFSISLLEPLFPCCRDRSTSSLVVFMIRYSRSIASEMRTG